jgi:spore germination cell wall hydrolase CwlJ-like protein
LRRLALGCLALTSLPWLAACGHVGAIRMSERECLARAMYFESIRSSDEGMLAVGTVVMNRVRSGKYESTVCGVVGQKNQFAPGVLTKQMPKGASRDRAMRIAQAVLSGQRHPGVGKAEFFHTAGRTYRYENMHYVLVAGGNAFYERRPTGRAYIPRTVIVQAGPRDSISPASLRVNPKYQPAPVLAAVPPSPPPVRLAPPSIESIILAEAGL